MSRIEQIRAELVENDQMYDEAVQSRNWSLCDMLLEEQHALERELDDLINRPRLFGNRIRWAIQTWKNYFKT